MFEVIYTLLLKTFELNYFFILYMLFNSINNNNQIQN